MQILVFTVVAVALYFLADWLLRLFEAAAKRRFEDRGLIFFAILLTLAIGAFALIRNLFPE